VNINKLQILSSSKTILFITLVVAIMPIISLPSMIDGISYIKVFVAAICVIPFLPFMVSKLFETKRGNMLWILTVSILLVVLFLFFQIQNDYRGLFGAPGRHNGTLAILLYLCFTIFGIYVYIKNSILVIMHGLVMSSSLTFLISNLHLIYPELSIFPSLDIGSSQFRDNVDNLAPLASMAFTASIILYLKSRNILYLILQIPAVYFVIKWQLLQPIVAFIPSIILVTLKERYMKLRFFALTPLVVAVGYISGIKLLPFTPFVMDSSIQERLRMITYLEEIWIHFSLFPIHIDALSDFSASLEISGAYLDDFHNVYLQVLFSFGLVIGVAIIMLIAAPLLLSTQQFNKTPYFFPVYFNFFLSLFFSIASPNYMYFGFILIGYFLGGTLSDAAGQLQSNKREFGKNFVIYLAVVSILILQTHDFSKRMDVSSVTRAYSTELVDEKYFEKLLDKVSDIRDAEYKFQVARNFYSIGKCAYGNLVFEQLLSINTKEVRNAQLVEIRKSCEQRWLGK